MSRSRKYPIFKDNDGPGRKKSIKQIYNRRLRRNGQFMDIPNYGAYKKYNDPWDICDYKILPDENDPVSVRKASTK